MKLLDKPSIAPADSPIQPPKPRLDWVDNLRTLMIVFVVNMHACVTYSHVGSWYYNSPPEPSLNQKLPFVFWQAHLQSFFMGLLFLLAGYYADRSLARRGAGSFVKERLRRLGIPTLVYMLAVHPFIVLVLHPGYAAGTWADYLHFVISGRFIGASGPMWFAFALLLFSLAFAAVGNRLPNPKSAPLRLSPVALIAIGAALAVASFLVRIVQPLGSSVLNFQLAYFSQYVVAFGLGIYVSRRDGLSALAGSPVARRAGLAGVILGPIALAGVAIASLPIPEHAPPAFNGGWNLPALLLASWEQLTGIALALGAIAFCAYRLNRKTPLSAWLSDRSFAVYMLHPPVLVAISLLLQPVRTNPFVMAPIVTILGLGVSYAVADLARRLPGLRTVL
ncbi:MAG TPA: acyltransferase [Fimbriimonadaceae bacterium]|nr:acyltransferase [Fimbriimonadaceae bacterium]